MQTIFHNRKKKMSVLRVGEENLKGIEMQIKKFRRSG